MQTLAQFEQKHFTLNAQEKRLLADAVAGNYCEISQTRPENAIKSGKDANVIRATFIRWLALGGDDEHPLHAHGIKLRGAWIKGILDLHGTVIASDLVLVNCHIADAPNFRGMNLNGSLIFSGSQLPKGLNADRAKIAGSVFLRATEQHRFESHGAIRLLGVTIGSNLSCNGAQLMAFEGQDALNSDRAEIAGSVFLRSTEQHRFESHGAIRFLAATIGGSLDCNGAQLMAFEGQGALNAGRAEIAGSVFLQSTEQHRFQSHGEIRLLGVTIGGDLSCNGAQLMAFEGQDTFNADGAEIAGGVFLQSTEQHRFESHGEIRLLGTTIGGDLSCNGAQLMAFEGQDALCAQGAVIAGNVFLRNGFRAEGVLSFISMLLDGVFQVERTAPILIDLSHAQISFLESQPSSWGEGLQLDGLIYDGFRESSWSGKDYLDWLKKQDVKDYGSKENPQTFKPQPWQQLISVLRKMGHDDIASDIAIAFQQRRYEIGKVAGFVPRFFHQVFGWLVGYGYKPLRLLWGMLGVWLFSATMYFCAGYHGIFTPSDPLVFQNSAYEQACRSYNLDGTERVINNADKNGNTHNWYTCGALVGEYTTFSPIAYSLDVILPLVDLGQEKAWGVYIATPKANGIHELFGHGSFNHAARFLVWCEILFGWIASLMLVAVLTGLTERDKR